MTDEQYQDFAPEAGMVIGQHWRLVQPLGSGAFGQVWLAEHTNYGGLKRAAKFIYPGALVRNLKGEADHPMLS